MAGERVDGTTGSWLYSPEFPDHWTRGPLYSLVEWVNGIAFRDIQFSPSGKPVIKIGNVTLTIPRTMGMMMRVLHDDHAPVTAACAAISIDR
jgi:hypothetical protein